ncbi:unnamed protein product [Nezara viridula]|uniref:Uncharacterized protein n=1 Tax=Nezara viridula TaxID=85310 RepID=A0A9P0H2H5_NEZVI|nr:unnamed protein product [Nezara viridula]
MARIFTGREGFTLRNSLTRSSSPGTTLHAFIRCRSFGTDVDAEYLNEVGRTSSILVSKQGYSRYSSTRGLDTWHFRRSSLKFFGHDLIRGGGTRCSANARMLSVLSSPAAR